MGFGERLKEAFGTDKPAEIARKLGITYQGAKNYLEDRIPSAETLLDISNSTGRSIHWLLTGHGPRLVNGEVVRPDQLVDYDGPLFKRDLPEEGEVLIYMGPKEHEIVQKLAGPSKPFEDQVRDLILEALKARGLVTDQVEESNLIFFGDYVPKMVEMDLLGEIAAGEPIHIVTDREPVQVPQDFIKRGKRYFVLRVRGESMIEDGIRDGALIVCESIKTAKTGDTVVAMIDGDKATVKKYYPERGRIRLQPANELHSPIFITDERLEIQGIVVGIFHRPQ